MSFRCARCDGETVVKDSRSTHVGKFNAVRRRRECLRCSHRFSTFETHEDMRTDIKKIAAAQNALAAASAGISRAIKVVGPAEEEFKEPVHASFDSNM